MARIFTNLDRSWSGPHGAGEYDAVSGRGLGAFEDESDGPCCGVSVRVLALLIRSQLRLCEAGDMES